MFKNIKAVVIFPAISGRLIPEKKVDINMAIMRGIETKDNILRMDPASRNPSPYKNWMNGREKADSRKAVGNTNMAVYFIDF